MFWTGSHAAIVAAEALAAAIVTARPHYRDGVEVPGNTARWAKPKETATPGLWAILAFPELDTPEGCTAVDVVEWPEAMP